MVETHWRPLEGEEVEFGNHSWELTGDVTVENTGTTLAVEGQQTDDVRGEPGLLYFEAEDEPASVNPGELEHHFDELRPGGDGDEAAQLRVSTDGGIYRYRLERLEYERG